ncbi:CHASE2 domain-containing protein [Leptothoe sp. EHU-05/26/07-4]
MDQTYRLVVTHVQQICLFDLTWGDGMQLTAQVPYPEELTLLHQRWQRAYYNFYRALQKADAVGESSAMRGRTGAVGQVPVAQTDLRSQLGQAEVRLLTVFQSWLERRELIGIREQLNRRGEGLQRGVTLYITCAAKELRRLPWETWELARGFGQGPPMRITRLPANISVAANPPKKQRRKARALVIIGDDSGLDFKQDLDAIDRLKTLVTIQKIGWQLGQKTNTLIDQVRDVIRDPEGWDMLFFFGHSNEMAELGGEIAIAPKTTISMRDLESDLTEAKRNGLQFALFNSCKGLDIADRLVALGLNQVAIMREPIHNEVAQYFLLQFLQQLSQYADVHTALQEATKALKAEKTMAYPSAYLVPSLFSHRGAQLFRLQPVGWQAKLTELWPSRKQGMALGAIAILSLLPPVRDRLMAGRLWTQAVARQITTQPLQADVSPPVLLVHVDETSIAKGIPDGDANPINRAYLAKLLDRIVELDSQIIGIDYLLDRRQDENNARLTKTLEKAVNEGNWLVLASDLLDKQEIGPSEGLAHPAWSMQGLTKAPASWHLKALQIGQDCHSRCPFSYLLAITHAARETPAGKSLTPSLDRTNNLRKELFETLVKDNNSQVLYQLLNYRLSPILSLSRWIEQRWFHPILDFSMPLSHIYDRIPAHALLEEDIQDLSAQYDWQNQIVLIGSGGYNEAGIGSESDYVPNPPAIQFWRDQTQDLSSRFTGVEAHSYMIHHFLNQHWMIPIPVLWMVGIGTIVGAMSALAMQRDQQLRRYRWLGLIGFSVGYGLFGIVVYGAASIVLPWLLPTATVWVYHIPGLQRCNQEKNL